MEHLNFDHSFPDQLQGFPGLRIDAGGGGSAFIAAQGAQLLSWCGSDGRERLYLSPQSSGMRRGDTGTGLAAPIRGGVPVCFPQFSGRGPMIKHGFARGLAWSQVDGITQFSSTDSAQSRAHWPHAYQLQLTFAPEPDSLTITLEVHNSDSQPWSFTAALHTYFRVDDIRSTALHGLHQVRYQDATAGNMERIQNDEMLLIPGEVDRVYLAPPPELQLVENGIPTLRIAQQGFADTVVWNPGPDNARTLTDMPDQDWLRMLCVEAAQASAPVLLAPGETWRGSQRLTLTQTPL